MTRWSKRRELSSTPMACQEGVWSVTWSLHPASTMCMALQAFLAWATFCSSWMKLETKMKWIVKYPSLGSAFWRQLMFLLLMNNLLVFPSFPPLYEIFVHQGGVGVGELGIRLSVFYQEKIKVREWISYIGHVPIVIHLKLFLDMVPSSSENFTRAMRGQLKRQQQRSFINTRFSLKRQVCLWGRVYTKIRNRYNNMIILQF